MADLRDWDLFSLLIVTKKTLHLLLLTSAQLLHIMVRGSSTHVRTTDHQARWVLLGTRCSVVINKVQLLARFKSRGGGGGTDSLSLSTNCETTAPLFEQRTAPVLLPPNLQPPLFMDNQAQPLEISVKWCIFCITYIIFYQIIVLKGFKNKFEYIQLLFDVEYWMQIL